MWSAQVLGDQNPQSSDEGASRVVRVDGLDGFQFIQEPWNLLPVEARQAIRINRAQHRVGVRLVQRGERKRRGPEVRVSARSAWQILDHLGE